MSTAAHVPLAKDALIALAPLMTYPGRCWLALRASCPPERQPAAITYFETTSTRDQKAA